MSAEFELPDGVFRCPTCGKFVADIEAYTDLPPGGIQSVDLPEAYCGEACAEAKQPPAVYEDDPNYSDVCAELDRIVSARRSAS